MNSANNYGAICRAAIFQTSFRSQLYLRYCFHFLSLRSRKRRSASTHAFCTSVPYYRSLLIRKFCDIILVTSHSIHKSNLVHSVSIFIHILQLHLAVVADVSCAKIPYGLQPHLLYEKMIPGNAIINYGKSLVMESNTCIYPPPLEPSRGHVFEYSPTCAGEFQEARPSRLSPPEVESSPCPAGDMTDHIT